MVVIYPDDSSTKFLQPIIEGIYNNLKIEIDFHYVDLSPIESFLEKIREIDSTRTIIYMGHGDEDELNGNNGFDTAIPIHFARNAFKNKKIVLLSCLSADFIFNLKNYYQSAIGFGNIPTGSNELSPKDYIKYNYESFECITLFKKKLAILFKNSMVEAYLLDYTFLQLYNSLRLRINKAVANCSLSVDKTERLVGELMFDLKKEIKIFGNTATRVFN